jgi:surfeit locus 1 family protein
MRLGFIEFKPALWPTLVTLIFLVFLTSLGFWQLDRARQKQEILDKYQADHGGTAISIDTSSLSVQGLDYQLAEAKGVFNTEQQFLLDNRTHKGAVGYHVITPLLIADETAILVDRGWVPLGVSREQLPDVSVDVSKRTIKGKLKPVQEKVFMLGEEQPRKGWPYRVHHVNIKRFSEELGYSLSPYLLLLNPDDPSGYVRDWKPFKFGPERNVGYAVTWFSLAVTLLLIYLVVNSRKVK